VGEGIETVFLIAQPEFNHISSTIVREIILGGADATPFIPKLSPMPTAPFRVNEG
jgi:pantetheine-phosphate adenylyltransferase